MEIFFYIIRRNSAKTSLSVLRANKMYEAEISLLVRNYDHVNILNKIVTWAIV
jgi:hypothetical protein